MYCPILHYNIGLCSHEEFVNNNKNADFQTIYKYVVFIKCINNYFKHGQNQGRNVLWKADRLVISGTMR